MTYIKIYNESTKIHVSAPYWLSVIQLAKCGENERFKNVEESNRWIFGYPKMWKKMMWRFVWIPAATFLDTHVFYLFFLFLLLIVVYAARSLID